MKKVAVTGYSGRLGFELARLGCVPFKANITSKIEIEKEINRLQPDVIINCAAKTKVDECETKKGFDDALAINFRGATNIQDVFSGLLIQMSTDYVFDCTKGPYDEKYKELSPINDYGFSKFGAEAGLKSWVFDTQNIVIVRTTGLYGGSAGSFDFASTLISTLEEGKTIKVTNELHGNQTYVPHLAEALMKLTTFDFSKSNVEIIHIASEEVVTRFSFALMIADVFNLDKNLIVPCKNKDVPGWTAKRPTLGGLKVDKAKKMGLPIYSIADGLKEYLNWYTFETI